MLRVILGIVAGFIAWSILWVGSDQFLSMLSPAWYGAHQAAFEKAIVNKTEFTPDSTIMIMSLVRSALISIMAGFLAAVIAKGNRNGRSGLEFYYWRLGYLCRSWCGTTCRSGTT